MPRSRPSACGSRKRFALVPAGQLGRAVVAREQMLARVGQAARLVDVDVVAAPQLERIEVERQRELVDRLLERGRAFHHAGRAERVLRRAGSSCTGTSSRARRRSDRACGRGSARGTPSRPAPSRRRRRRRSPTSVPSRRAPRRTVCRVARASAAVELLGMPVVDEPHRPAGDPRELGRGERLEAGALLARRSPPPTNSVTHAHLVLAQPERRLRARRGRRTSPASRPRR